METLEVIFWICAGVVGYTYVGYPALLALLSLLKKDRRHLGPYSGSVSIVLAAHNEEAGLANRLRELTDQLQCCGVTGEVIVVSDGSTDRTVNIALDLARLGTPVRVLELPDNQGKAAALTLGCQSATGDVLVFADARQRWAPDALGRLLENFADPCIGAVSGDLVLETAAGALAGVGLYWRLEKWLRKRESQLYAQVGVTGAICAVRRTLFRPVPAGTLLDDVYWPMQVVMQGYRVVHDERARAFDRLPDKPRDEFRRKVRTLAGNFQLMGRLPAILLPWRNPVWLQWLSHKLLRLAVPWALLGMLPASLFADGWLFQGTFWAQVAGYGLAVAGLTRTIGSKVPLAGASASFLVLNAAAFLAFWVWITGRAGGAWRKVAYQVPVGQPTPT